MIRTSDLIDALVADARPVRRLAPPLARAAAWLLVAALVFALLALGHGVRADLGARLVEPSFALGLAAALATGILAATAAFMLNLPDRSRGWLLLPLPTLALWIAGIGQACLTNWVAIGPAGMQLGETARCFSTLLLTSLPLSIALFAMLRRGSVLRARALALMASIAVAAMTATAMSLFHRLDASALVLIWNLGVAGVIVALGSWLGPRAARAA